MILEYWYDEDEWSQAKHEYYLDQLALAEDKDEMNTMSINKGGGDTIVKPEK